MYLLSFSEASLPPHPRSVVRLEFKSSNKSTKFDNTILFEIFLFKILHVKPRYKSMRTYKLKHANEPTPQLLLIISIILSLNSHTFSHESQKSDTLLPCKSCIYNKLRQQHTLTTIIKPINHQPLNKYTQGQISTCTNKLTILSPIDTIQIWISNATQPRTSRNFRISQKQKINTFQSFRQHNANNVLNHTGTNFHSFFHLT